MEKLKKLAIGAVAVLSLAACTMPWAKDAKIQGEREKPRKMDITSTTSLTMELSHLP